MMDDVRWIMSDVGCRKSEMKIWAYFFVGSDFFRTFAAIYEQIRDDTIWTTTDRAVSSAYATGPNDNSGTGATGKNQH